MAKLVSVFWSLARRAVKYWFTTFDSALLQASPAARTSATPTEDAVRIDDAEIVRTGYELLYREGLFLGGTSGTNVAAAVQVARQLGPGNTIVNILCDGGHKSVSRFWNRDYLAQKGLAEHVDAVRRTGGV